MNLLSLKVWRKGFGYSCLGSTRYRSVYGTEPGEATGYGATSVLEQSQTGVETGTRNGWDLEKGRNASLASAGKNAFEDSRKRSKVAAPTAYDSPGLSRIK